MACSCLWSPVNGRLPCDACVPKPVGTPEPAVAQSQAVAQVDPREQQVRDDVQDGLHPDRRDVAFVLAALDTARAETAAAERRAEVAEARAAYWHAIYETDARRSAGLDPSPAINRRVAAFDRLFVLGERPESRALGAEEGS